MKILYGIIREVVVTKVTGEKWVIQADNDSDEVLTIVENQSTKSFSIYRGQLATVEIRAGGGRISDPFPRRTGQYDIVVLKDKEIGTFAYSIYGFTFSRQYKEIDCSKLRDVRAINMGMTIYRSVD